MAWLGHRRVLAFGVLCIPAVVLAGVVLLAPGPASGGSQTPPEPSSTSVVRELSERRTASSRTFFTERGALATRIYAGSVNFKDGNGKWQRIDDDLTPTPGGYVNKANRFRLAVPDSSERPVRVTEGDAWVEYRLEGKASQATVDGPAARYRGVAAGVDAEYRADGDGVKETLTLGGPGSERRFRFRLRASAGLVPKERADRSIDFVDGEGHVPFSFAPPVMWDSAKPARTSSRISVALSRVGDDYLLDLTPDARWLDDRRRAWPVHVDPTLGLSGSERDCYIMGGGDDPEGRYQNIASCASPYLPVGMASFQDCPSDGGPCYEAHPAQRSLLKFNLGSAIPKDAAVQLATMYLYNEGPSNPLSVSVHRLGRAFTNSVNWQRADLNVPWTSPGGDFEPVPAATNPYFGHIVGWNGWFLTDLVSRWISGATPNHGVLVKATSESGTNSLSLNSTETALAARKPYLEVQWTPPTGQRSYHTFEDQELTDRSSLGVNVANGNLLIRNKDLHIAGTGLDLAISRSYNSLTGASGSLGPGWNLGIGQDVRLMSNSDGSVSFYGTTGEVSLFRANADGTFDTPPGVRATLRRVSSTAYELTYNTTGETMTFTNPGSGSTAHLTKHADRYGNYIYLGYNSGVLVSIFDTRGRGTAVSQVGGKVWDVTDWTGRTLSYRYNAQGLLHTYTDTAGGTTSYGYDTSSRLNSITSPAGRVTKISYDGSGRVWKVIRTTDAAHTSGPTTVFTYSTGAPCATSETKTVVSDPLATGINGHTTTYCSDASNTVLKKVDAANNATTYTYDNQRNRTSMRRPAGGVTNFAYDQDTRNLLCVQRGVTTIQDCRNSSSGLKTSLEYANTDALTRFFPTRITNPQGHSISVCYNGATPGCGAATGPPGSVRSITNQLVTENTQTFGYNSKGQVTSLNNARNYTTTYGYDSNHHLTSIVPPAGSGLGGWVIEPDALSRPRVVTDGKGQTATYGYDALDRTTSTSYAPGGPNFTYGYDNDGNPRSLVDPGGTTTYISDALGRLEREAFPGGASNAYTYDAAGNLKTITDAGGTTTYNYDSLNQLGSVVEPGQPGSTEFRYNADGAREQIRYPSGITVNTGYDLPSGRIKTVSNRGPSKEDRISSFTYAYVVNGRDTELPQTVTLHTGHTITNSYDALDRLTDAVSSAPSNEARTFRYRFDGNGNRTQSSVDSGGIVVGRTYQYNAGDRLVDTTPAPSTPYTYDANGNLLTSPNANFTYNGANQTTSVWVKARSPLVAAYEPLAYRGDGQAQIIKDGVNAVQSNLLGISSRGTGTDRYTRAADGTLLSQRTPSRSNYLFDGYGSVTGLTEPNGAVEQTYSYDPYGHPPSDDPSGNRNPFGWQGRYGAGAGDWGVFCGSPSATGPGYYDSEDGSLTQPPIIKMSHRTAPPERRCKELSLPQRVASGLGGAIALVGGGGIFAGGVGLSITCFAIPGGDDPIEEAHLKVTCVKIGGGAITVGSGGVLIGGLAVDRALSGKDCAAPSVDADISPCGSLGSCVA